MILAAHEKWAVFLADKGGKKLEIIYIYCIIKEK